VEEIIVQIKWIQTIRLIIAAGAQILVRQNPVIPKRITTTVQIKWIRTTLLIIPQEGISESRRIFSKNALITFSLCLISRYNKILETLCECFCNQTSVLLQQSTWEIACGKCIMHQIWFQSNHYDWIDPHLVKMNRSRFNLQLTPF
jgi:hypothetical protein